MYLQYHLITYMARNLSISQRSVNVAVTHVYTYGVSFLGFRSVVSTVYEIQWDLFIKDTKGPANLSTVEKLSTLQRWKMY